MQKNSLQTAHACEFEKTGGICPHVLQTQVSAFMGVIMCATKIWPAFTFEHSSLKKNVEEKKDGEKKFFFQFCFGRKSVSSFFFADKKSCF